MREKKIIINETINSKREKKQLLDIQFYPRRASDNYISIYCHISINRKRTKSPFSTLIKIPAKAWCNKAQAITAKDFEVESYELNRIKASIYEIFLSNSNREVLLNSEKLKRLYLDRNKKEYTLYEIYQKWIEYMKSMINVKIKESTFKTYKDKFDHLEKFLKSKNAELTLLNEVDYNFISQFDDFLKKQPKIKSKDYKARCITTLQRVVKWSNTQGYVKTNNMILFNPEKSKIKKPEYIELDELLLFKDFNFFSSTLQKVADCFVLQSFTSMDFVDIIEFSKKEHIKRINGRLWIIKKRGKAPIGSEKQVMKIPLLPEARRIFEKYDWKPPIWFEKRGKNLSYDKYRKYLKECADILDININLVTKTGRRTFVNLMYEKGFSSDEIANIVGHNSTKTTLKYYLRFSLKRIEMKIEKIFGKDYLVG
ncbi:MAG: phage integrase SAM-like domain-containing protein [Bacteroidota bacterium]